MAAALDAPARYGRDHGASGAEMAARQRKKGIRVGRGRIGVFGSLFGLGARFGQSDFNLPEHDHAVFARSETTAGTPDTAEDSEAAAFCPAKVLLIGWGLTR